MGHTHAEQVPDELSKVNAAISFEEEGKLVAVELVLGVNDMHGQGSLLDLGPAHLEHLLLLLQLLAQPDFLFVRGQSQDTLRVRVHAAKAPGLAVASRRRALLRELLPRHLAHNHAQVFPTVRLETIAARGTDTYSLVWERKVK